ncbi:MAG: cytochrome c [Proteobacteria bacterium]|nr:cytochrome c [Pseudomonadota bacterium]
MQGSLLLIFTLLFSTILSANGRDLVKEGKQIFQISGGCACHTDTKNKGPFMAGGRPVKTPFGIIYSTNITPHSVTGIGDWSEEDFIRAMTLGVSPGGQHYFPVFPYTSFTKMSRPDLVALKAYLFSLPPVDEPNRPLEMNPPFSWRWTLYFWKMKNFTPGEFVPDKSKSEERNRGAYLVRAIAHCEECHTPRDLSGGLKKGQLFAGSVEGPEGELAPNITPHEKTGVGSWSHNDMIWFLQTGLKPDGDDTQGLMSELIDKGYQYVKEQELQKMAEYLSSLDPINNKVEAKKGSQK